MICCCFLITTQSENSDLFTNHDVWYCRSTFVSFVVRLFVSIDFLNKNKKPISRIAPSSKQLLC